MNERELFLKHVAQTSPAPMALEIARAEACSLFDRNGREYIDLIGGISVANTGHRHPAVLAAIGQQTSRYLHVMVYGEFVESPQVQYATMLSAHLPASLNAVYFTNSGTEAVEGAMKLAKRATNRNRIIAFNHSYHGSTQGALSIIGSEYWRNAFRPLLPGIIHAEYGSEEMLDSIDESVACVIAETIQAEAGVVVAPAKWMRDLRERCNRAGSLLVLDEIQTGFGRTGKLWGFEHFDIVPDILLLGKALGGGMPLGAFVADQSLMGLLTDNPVLGHITTFGGHPVCCAAGMAGMKALLEEGMMEEVHRKEARFRSLLIHPLIKGLRSFGLWFAVEFDSFETNKKVIDYCLDIAGEQGVAMPLVTDWFLFAPECMRISPPLVIKDEQISTACAVIIKACEAVS